MLHSATATPRDPRLDAAMPHLGETGIAYAVYGTLRPLMGNDHVWEGRAEAGALTRLHGLAMYDQGYFPFAVDAAPDSSIVVQILKPHAATAAALQRDLDRLEGVARPGRSGGLYERRAVRYFDQEEQSLRWAWVYLCTNPSRVQGLPLVASGDWCARG